MLCRILVAVVVISYLICVLVLSGVQKEDLDASLLEKLQRHNIKIDELSDEKLQKECRYQTMDDAKETTEPSDSEGSNKKPVELILNGDEKDKIEENLSRTLEPADIASLLKYFDKKQKVKSADTVIVKENISQSDYNSSTKEDTRPKHEEDLAKKQTNQSKNENTALEMALKLLTDTLGTKKKNEPKKPSYIENLFKNAKITNENDNTNSADIDKIMKFVSKYVTNKQSGTKKDNRPETDNAIKELNQILKNNKNHADEEKLNAQNTPQVEYIPYGLEKQESIQKRESNVNPEDYITFTKNYAYLRKFTENTPDPDIPKQKYNYYLQSQPIVLTTPGQITDTTKNNINFKSITEGDKEIKISPELIRQIAESVKDIVLKDLKNHVITEDPRKTETFNDATTKLLVNSTTEKILISTAILSDGTSNTVSSSMKQSTKAETVQGQDKQLANEMAKIVALLSEMKIIKSHDSTVKPRNIPKTRRRYESLSSTVRVRTYESNSRQKFAPIFVDVQKHPELMPPPIIQGQYTEEKSIIPVLQRTPNEIQLAPMLIQTNSDQIAPLSIPIMKPGIMNLNIMVTTESPFPRLRLSQDKWNRPKNRQGPQREKTRRRNDVTKPKTIDKKYENLTESNNSTYYCARHNKDHVLLNKTDEIMTRLKNIETLFANLTSNNRSALAKYEKQAENNSYISYGRERQNNKIIQYFQNVTPEYHENTSNVSIKNVMSSDTIDKKIEEYEIRLASLKQLKKIPNEREEGLNKALAIIALNKAEKEVTNDEEIINNIKSKTILKKPLQNTFINYPEKELSKYEDINNTIRNKTISKKPIDNPPLDHAEKEIKQDEDIINRIKTMTLGKSRSDRPKIGEKVLVYAKKTEEIDNRLKNLEREINNLRQQIKEGPNLIDQHLNHFRERSFQNIEAKYHRPDYAARYTRQRTRMNPKRTPPKHSNVAPKPFSPRTDILTDLKDMNIRLYKSKTSDDGKDINIEPLDVVDDHYVPKHTKEIRNHYRDSHAERFNPYKDLVTWRTTRRRNNRKETQKHNFRTESLQNEEIRGFHKKLETVSESPDLENNSNENVEVTLSRQMQPIQETNSRFDDTNFNNFLKTQQKVNSMLERIIATKTEPEEEIVAVAEF